MFQLYHLKKTGIVINVEQQIAVLLTVVNIVVETSNTNVFDHFADVSKMVDNMAKIRAENRPDFYILF